jgi:hypothetical protein
MKLWNWHPVLTVLLALIAAGPSASAASSMKDEFKVKRQGPFEFAEPPRVTRDGDRVTIRFTAKAFCDVTIAIEDGNGRIVRHLASGVLGKNPPPPFQKDSLEQTVVWDSKDDRGRYVDDLENTVIRVSLGLKPRYERHFLWCPHRRFEMRPPSFAAQPDGVYVFDGTMTDFIYRFDHDGNYARTVYPFPSDKRDKLVGVRTRVFEQSGTRLPWKSGYLHSTLLTCGENTRGPTSERHVRSSANATMGIRKGQIAVAYYSLNTLATDGSTGGRRLEGPETHVPKSGYWPRSIAIGAGGDTAYVTGFHMTQGVGANSRGFWMRGVGKVDVANGKKGDKMRPFVGALTPDHKQGGHTPGRFTVPYCVDCDAKGRVYVSDHFNDRIQVFDPSGKHLRSIKIAKPTDLCVDPRNGEVWVFSWAVDSPYFRKSGGDGYGRGSEIKPTLTHLGPLERPTVRATYTFPITDRTLGGGRHGGTQYRGIVDFWAPCEGPSAWVISGAHPRYGTASVDFGQIRILRQKKGTNTLEVFKDFTQLARKHLPYMRTLSRSQLAVNPKTGNLWVPRATTVIDPKTGKLRRVQFPQQVKELAFDMDGHAYLSTGVMISRFAVSRDLRWREVPFDYGESKGGRIAALTTGGGPFHSGGISVSPKGHVVVAVLHGGVKQRDPKKEAERRQMLEMAGVKKWMPEMYRGRAGKLIVRVWDKHGKGVNLDAVKGIGYCHNVFMDKNDDIYIATGAFRKGYRDENTGTLVKVPSGSRILASGAALPLGTLTPDRPPDTGLGGIGGKAWWPDAKWFYGGVGFNGKNHGGIHACHCAQFRVTHDYFARTFVPETVHYTVGVLDSAGNLIMRIGQYGNVDDGTPLVGDPRIKKPRSIGGNEVGLFHPAYLAVHSDRRLFINDPGNDHIVSVKLGYHTDHRTPLKGVSDDAR